MEQVSRKIILEKEKDKDYIVSFVMLWCGIHVRLILIYVSIDIVKLWWCK